ncbi:MAG: class I SAM-dependent methyltransferase [Symploca sp. SIO2D2]|nr:class I SAM-dependent methyltransferase [Symploca sp. SIO2D2]
MANHYSYLLHWSDSISAKSSAAKILDYGCGSGKVVLAGRNKGLNIFGADVFYAGANSKEEVEMLNLLGKEIQEIKQGKINFEDATFDLVLSNQVFEHVQDLESVLREIHRVMKKDALLLCLFPAKEVFREGHIGIPFVHWLAKDSKIRYYYALSLRCLGLGYFKANKTKIQWTQDALNWLDKYTIYRDKKEIVAIFNRYFTVEMIEKDYIKYKLSFNPRLSWLDQILKIPLMPELSSILMQKLAGMVFLAKKKETF